MHTIDWKAQIPNTHLVQDLQTAFNDPFKCFAHFRTRQLRLATEAVFGKQSVAFGNNAKVPALMCADWLVEEGQGNSRFVIRRARLCVIEGDTDAFGDHYGICPL